MNGPVFPYLGIRPDNEWMYNEWKTMDIASPFGKYWQMNENVSGIES